MEKLLYTTLTILGYFSMVATATGVMYIALTTGLDRQAVADCIKLQHQAVDYPDFYITKSEAMKCEYVSIRVNAPIHE